MCWLGYGVRSAAASGRRAVTKHGQRGEGEGGGGEGWGEEEEGGVGRTTTDVSDDGAIGRRFMRRADGPGNRREL